MVSVEGMEPSFGALLTGLVINLFWFALVLVAVYFVVRAAVTSALRRAGVITPASAAALDREDEAHRRAIDDERRPEA
ncbi:hypothetical protein EDF44_3349 [Rathayibacter sp. PhB185]|nr:hypothetical protein EDF45_3243 [Rathayibacter sp. PhB186]ROS48716.1 hypothetical protein EDF44_3349 [Rathayibacter sp. PhB185]TCL82589.1 hypothetical protein EDF49_105143 [Rathayibacter sp. PhB192]TCM27928.1 hypothetical protein EDF43_105143 [Rathayibacter sp. PhB179]